MGRISNLGHVGLFVTELERMRDFYSQVLEMEVTDQDLDIGLVFLSSQPDEEHHELALVRGRDPDVDATSVQQVSWKVKSFEDLLVLYDRLKDRDDIEIEQVVTHGIAYGVYFYDPEGNRSEVYWSTGDKVPQPYRKELDFEQPPEQILTDAHRLLEESGPDFQWAR